MQINFQFPDFENTPALQEYAESHLRSLQHRLDKRFKNVAVTVRGLVDGRNPDGTPKEFIAELLVKVPNSKTPFVAKKHNPDFRSALTEVMEAMESIMQRESEKTERSRKTLGKSHYLVRKVKREGLPSPKAKKPA